MKSRYWAAVDRSLQEYESTLNFATTKQPIKQNNWNLREKVRKIIVLILTFAIIASWIVRSMNFPIIFQRVVADRHLDRLKKKVRQRNKTKFPHKSAPLFEYLLFERKTLAMAMALLFYLKIFSTRPGTARLDPNKAEEYQALRGHPF